MYKNYISVLLLSQPYIMQLHGDNSELIILNEHANIDPRSQTVRRINFVVAIPILIVFNILPVIVLILYSFKCSRAYLAKCRLNCLSLTAFTEKFYSCYKDGLDGGKDLRFLSGLYFILRYVAFLKYYLFRYISTFSDWLYWCFLFLITAVIIAYLKPYKKWYVNSMDVLLLLYFSVICRLLDLSCIVY